LQSKWQGPYTVINATWRDHHPGWQR
jgi:hypothetical protein